MELAEKEHKKYNNLNSKTLVKKTAEPIWFNLNIEKEEISEKEKEEISELLKEFR